MLAGVFMNAVLTFAIFLGLALYYGEPTALTAPVIAQVVDGYPAAAAGLAAGDSISAVGGETVRTWDDLVKRVSASAGHPLSFVVWSHGASRTTTITPRAIVDTNPTTGAVTTVGKIGAARRLVRHPMGVLRGVADAWGGTYRAAGLIVVTLGELATKPAAWHSLSGPVGIIEGVGRHGAEWVRGSARVDCDPQHQRRGVQPAPHPDPRWRADRRERGRVDQGPPASAYGRGKPSSALA